MWRKLKNEETGKWIKQIIWHWTNTETWNMKLKKWRNQEVMKKWKNTKLNNDNNNEYKNGNNNDNNNSNNRILALWS